MEKIYEDKQKWVHDYVRPALIAMDIGIEDVQYVANVHPVHSKWVSEIVVVTVRGEDYIACVNADSLLGIWKDVTRQVLMEL